MQYDTFHSVFVPQTCTIRLRCTQGFQIPGTKQEMALSLNIWWLWLLRNLCQTLKQIRFLICFKKLETLTPNGGVSYQTEGLYSFMGTAAGWLCLQRPLKPLQSIWNRPLDSNPFLGIFRLGSSCLQITWINTVYFLPSQIQVPCRSYCAASKMAHCEPAEREKICEVALWNACCVTSSYKLHTSVFLACEDKWDVL